MNKLYVIDGPHKGKCFNLNDGITTVGKSSDNDICLSEMGVSRHHAKFLKKENRIFIVDVSGFQGVLIDGEKIQPGVEVEIRKESNFMIGNSILSFQKNASGENLARTYSTDTQRKLFDTPARSDR